MIYNGMHVPVTPTGTLCIELRAKTPEKAWGNLLRDAAHMPYKTVEAFKTRGYTVVKL